MIILLLTLYVAAMLAAGLFLVRKFDRFLRNGGFHPYWDEEEERNNQRPLQAAQNEKSLHDVQGRK